MIHKIIEQVTNEVKIEHEFQPETLQLITTTWIGGNQIHEHKFCLEGIYTAFIDRYENSQSK
jgi:hypothetical protein|tara:strand:- start:401 stop:586 length:186 start_codon:yes stop_codon:yes gene_type:complete